MVSESLPAHGQDHRGHPRDPPVPPHHVDETVELVPELVLELWPEQQCSGSAAHGRECSPPGSSAGSTAAGCQLSASGKYGTPASADDLGQPGKASRLLCSCRKAASIERRLCVFPPGDQSVSDQPRTEFTGHAGCSGVRKGETARQGKVRRRLYGDQTIGVGAGRQPIGPQEHHLRPFFCTYVFKLYQKLNLT